MNSNLKVGNTPKSKLNCHYILMGDIIQSKKYPSEKLELFRKQIDSLNEKHHQISPLTITLGDEFQGICKSLEQGIEIIFDLELLLLESNYPFKMRYAIGYGEIITPINSTIAHGMYGEALTKTRQLLEHSKSDKRRRIDLLIPNKEFQEIFNNLFLVYQSFLDNWKEKDYTLISHFHENKDYKEVAKKVHKLKHQIWKKEKSLRIREFFHQKEAILGIAKFFDSILDSK